DYVAYRGVTLLSSNAASLVDELRRIPAEVVRSIYLQRYWEPSRAGDLPPALALMHFDAAVNHGLGGAARLLQAAVGAAVDGEIGPLTPAAARAAPLGQVLEAYAGLRRERYRKLDHFWRFGRGWLNRVDRTLTAARALIAVADAINREGAQPMQD